MKNVLIISYYWPPSGGPGVQRVLKFCKYLPKYGWNPIVLTVKDGDFPLKDSSLNSTLKNGNIYFSKSYSFHKIVNFLSKKKHTPSHQLTKSKGEGYISKLSRWIRLNLIVPDGRVGWYPNAIKVGSQIIYKRNIKVIFSTAPPFTTHLIGMSLSNRSGIPFVADFRDPWTDYHYYENNRLLITDKLDKYLERKVIKTADLITTAHKTMGDNFVDDYAVIFNGYDEDDFKKTLEKDKDKIVISHIGTLSQKQNPTYFFDAVHKLNEMGKIYHIDLIGSVHPDIANEINIKGYNYFINIKKYLPHDIAIQKMRKSHFLLLIINNAKKNMGLINAKIFEYIRSGSKIILIGPDGGDSEKIIKNTNSGFCFNYNEKKGFEKILTADYNLEPKNYKKYSREILSKELANRLNQVHVEKK